MTTTEQRAALRELLLKRYKHIFHGYELELSDAFLDEMLTLIDELTPPDVYGQALKRLKPKYYFLRRLFNG